MRTIKQEDFACSCGDDGKAVCQEVREWAADHLGREGESAETKQALLLDRLIYNLSAEYRVTITGIYTDQWGAIATEGGPRRDPITTYIQFDRFLDGLAFTYKAYFDRYGEHLDWAAEEIDDEGDAEERTE